MTTFQTLRQELPTEIKRVKSITASFDGFRKVIAAYESHFQAAYAHGINVVYEVSRVNVLRRLRGEAGLI